jgi:SAM-dependent methyltransferase
MEGINLNIGCGLDKKDGYINIDGAQETNPDVVMVFPDESLLDRFPQNSVSEVLMQDFLEHHFRWEAEKILREVYAILKPDGVVRIRVPNLIWIALDLRIPWRIKINLLWGGQDMPQGKGDDEIRKKHPTLFCHKYGYTPGTLRSLLRAVGYVEVKVKGEGMNFWAIARK